MHNNTLDNGTGTTLKFISKWIWILFGSINFRYFKIATTQSSKYCVKMLILKCHEHENIASKKLKAYKKNYVKLLLNF